MNDSTGGAEGGPRTERNEHRMQKMITANVHVRAEHRNGVRGDRTR